MKYTTSNKKWLKALTIDTILIGGLTFALMAENTAAQTVLVFFMWWLVCIGAVFYIVMFLMGAGRDISPEIRKTWDEFWTPIAPKLACSETFLFYHVATDIFCISLLLGNGYTWLPFFMTINFVCSLILIQYARTKVEATNSSTLPV